MTRLEFDDLVGRLEARYCGREAALARRTLGWVTVGLLALVAWIVLLVLLGAGLLALGTVTQAPLGFFLILGGVAMIVFGLCQAAYVLRVEPIPRSYRALRAGEAPILSAALAELGAALGCRPFDEVHLTMDFNAAVYQVPRLGFLGWPRTYLEIGLPLALALTPGEMRAVLAHECAHLSSRHGQRFGWLFLLDQTWDDLIRAMQRPASGRLDRAGRWAFAKFLDWFWPRLHARTLLLSRAHEHEADRLAAGLSGAAEVTASLWRLECYVPWLAEGFWPDLWKRVRETPEPPADVYDLLSKAYRSGPAPEDANRYVERGLSRVAAREATHPSFLDRVRPLGQGAADMRRTGFPRPSSLSAAEFFLGDHFADLSREMSEQWRTTTRAAWRERRRQALAPPPPSAAVETDLDIQPLWETARAAAMRDSLEKAEPLLRQVLERDPGHAGAAALLGQHLAGRGDPEGERLLAAVLSSRDENWLTAAGAALEAYYRGLGLTDSVRAMRAALDRHEADVRAAQAERASVTARDRFLDHGLLGEPIASLQALLASLPDVEAAWLARKDLAYFPNRPLFVLCVRSIRTRWWRGAEADQNLASKLAPKVRLPGQVLVIGQRGSFRALARKVLMQAATEVFRRSVDTEQLIP